MVSNKLVINLPLGLHLRPISNLCNQAADFKSTILIKMGNKCVNAKSLISVLSAGIRFKDEIELCCEGSDEEEALELLSRMIEEGLGDELGGLS